MFLFKTFSYLSFRWLLILFLSLVSPTKEQSSLTAPIEWPFNTKIFAGPDGPWPIMYIQVGWPSKNVSVFPGRNPATLVITSNVCFQQGANYSNPGAEFYDRTSEAPGMTTNDFNVSKDIVPGWNANLTYPMQVDGPVKHTLERITVLAENGSPQYVDNQSMLLSDGMAIRYAGGIQISLEIGILSLASQVTLTPPPSGGPSWYTYTPLSFLGRDSTPETPISSQSWGLHMGSAQCNIPGSLYFGGYDQNRLLRAPGIFNNSATPLTGISINSTIEAFSSTNNLLDTASSSSSSSDAFLSIIPEPALPYLYLPPAVCTSIASSLPLSYNAGLQLYTWDLTHPSLPTLLTSLSTLEFTFTNSSGTSTTVSIPLALLNLTLTPPLVPETTPYFPCRPYSPENDTGQYYLGRAFLQGAFIGQNWDSGAYFLAQAPGPKLPRSQVVVIGPNDKTISAVNDTLVWEDTWKGILSKDGVVQLPSTSHNISFHNSSTSSSPPDSIGSSGKRPFLSVGAKAAIGVCCAVVGFALIIGAVLGILRKRNRSRKVSRAMECFSAQDNSQRAWQKPELNGQGKVEIEAAALARELAGHWIHEADGSEFVHEIGERGMVGVSYEVEGHVGRSELR